MKQCDHVHAETKRRCLLPHGHAGSHACDSAADAETVENDVAKERRRLSRLLGALGAELENSLGPAARTADGEQRVTLHTSADGEAIVAIEDYGAGISLHEVALGEGDAVQGQEVDLDPPLILALHEATGRWLAREHGRVEIPDDDGGREPEGR